jgi:hypothetical protein
VRVYVPATSQTLRALLESSTLDAPMTGFAVTPGLREWYHDEDIEELEYAAMIEAARASLRLLDADSEAKRCRVVLALEVTDADVSIRDDLDRGVVRLAAPVPLGAVASIHLDDATAFDAVAAAAQAINAADLGEPAAQDLVDDAEGFELAWYANQELAQVVGQL